MRRTILRGLTILTGAFLSSLILSSVFCAIAWLSKFAADWVTLIAVLLLLPIVKRIGKTHGISHITFAMKATLEDSIFWENKKILKTIVGIGTTLIMLAFASAGTIFCARFGVVPALVYLGLSGELFMFSTTAYWERTGSR